MLPTFRDFRSVALASALGCAASVHAMQADRSPMPDDPAPPGSMPYEVAYDLPEMAADLAASPDGRHVAYVIRRQPHDYDPARLHGNFPEDGTPATWVGSKVHVVSATGGDARLACDIKGYSWEPSWSPDGKQLAMYSNADGAVNVWIHDLASRACRKISAAPIQSKHWQGDAAVWSPDGKHLYVPLKNAQQKQSRDPKLAPPTPLSELARKPSVYAFRSERESIQANSDDGVQKPSGEAFRERMLSFTADVARIEVATGETRVLVPFDADPLPYVIRRSPSGRWLTYLSIFGQLTPSSPRRVHSLAAISASGGTPRVLFENEPMSELDYLRLAYQWHPTEDRLVYLKDGGLWLVDFSGDAPSAPRRIGESLGRLAEFPLVFSRDGLSVVVGTKPDEKSTLIPAPEGLAVIDLDTGAGREVPIDTRHWSLKKLIQANAQIAWQPQANTVSMQLIERATGRTAIVRADMRSGHHQVLWQGAMMRLGGFASADGHGRLFAQYEDFSTPAEVYAYDAKFSQRQRLTNIETRVDAVKGGTLHVFESVVPQFDGSFKKVSTGVILPPGKKAGDRVPAVVMFYPGNDMLSGAGDSFAGGTPNGLSAAVLTSRGYGIVLAHALTGPRGQTGNVINEIVDSLMPQVYRAADLGYIDIERLALNGQSFGAFSTAAVISRSTLFRAAISSNGPYDLTRGYGRMYDIERSDSTGIAWTEAAQPRIGNHLWADLRRVIDNSPFMQADKIRTPLLIVQGGDDGFVEDAQAMYTALNRLGRPVQLAVYEGSGHYIAAWPRANAIDATKRVVAFLSEQLGNAGR